MRIHFRSLKRPTTHQFLLLDPPALEASLEMVNQLVSLNMGAANEAFSKLWKTEAIAMQIVAKRLRSIETV